MQLEPYLIFVHLCALTSPLPRHSLATTSPPLQRAVLLRRPHTAVQGTPCPAWNCVFHAEGPSHPGTPTPLGGSRYALQLPRLEVQPDDVVFPLPRPHPRTPTPSPWAAPSPTHLSPWAAPSPSSATTSSSCTRYPWGLCSSSTHTWCTRTTHTSSCR